MGRTLALVVAAGLVFPAAAAAADYAPTGRPGPPLSMPVEKLEKALVCGPGVDGAARAPVLLVHGTGATSEENWSWTYQPVFNGLGIPWCTVQLPERGQNDIQIAGEYVVHAIRTMHRRAGRRIAIVGHSQGGMIPRWPLRFWPDTRAMVDDQIGFAPSNHGTRLASLDCQGPCTPSSWQQWDRSNFLRALNSYQETFAGISYTAIWTNLDEVVVPPDGAALRSGDGAITNVALQDICSVDVADHFLIGLTDSVAFALAIDALNHDGPASVERVRRKGCFQDGMPGLQPAGALGAAIGYGRGEGGADEVRAEPELRCYVTDTCSAAQRRAHLRISVSPSRPPLGRMTRMRFKVWAQINGRARAVKGAVLRFEGRKLRTNGAGRASLRLRLGQRGLRPVTARADGYKPGKKNVRVRPAR